MSDNSQSIFDALKQIHEKYKFIDPLEEKGVPKDWVCVINSRTHSQIKAELAQQNPFPMIAQAIGDPVERFIRRELWVIDMADDGLNFMSHLEMFRKYAEYFLRRIELAKLRKQDEEASDSEAQS